MQIMPIDNFSWILFTYRQRAIFRVVFGRPYSTQAKFRHGPNSVCNLKCLPSIMKSLRAWMNLDLYRFIYEFDYMNPRFA